MLRWASCRASLLPPCSCSAKVSWEVIPLRRRNTTSPALQELNPIKARLVVLFSFNLYPSLKEVGGGGKKGGREKRKPGDIF